MKNEHEKDSSNELHISESHARIGVAILLVLVGFLCIVSYHWGKKKAYEEFVESLRGDSLGDKVSAALSSLYDAQALEEGEDRDESTESVPEQQQESPRRVVENPTEESAKEQQEVSPQQPQKHFYAELAGFGSQESAKRYVGILEQRNVHARIVPRTSISARGVRRTWFQVITEPMAFDTLQNTVNAIKERDHLKHVTIVEYKD